MIRHLEYTRARLGQVSERLRALVHPETCALDELLVAGPTDRIPRDEAVGRQYPPAELGERFGHANALEDEREPLEVAGDEIVVAYRRHQIVTVVAR